MFLIIKKYKYGKNLLTRRDRFQNWNQHAWSTKDFKKRKRTTRKQRRNAIDVWHLSGLGCFNKLKRGNDGRGKNQTTWKFDGFAIVQRSCGSFGWITNNRMMNWRKKKDKFTYEFDKIANTGKTNLNDPELLEILFIDKFHRTHEEFMNTPKEIVDLLLLKWWSDAKAEKKKSKSLSIKK